MKKRKDLVVLLMIVTALCYANALFAGFVWDDFNNVVCNDRLEKSEGVRDIFLHPSGGYYRPLSYFSVRFDHALWGENPFGYHLTNVLFHILNVILIFMIAVRLHLSDNASFLSAVLFAVHPVHTEAITYISGRSDIIAAFFIFSSFYFFLKSFNLKRAFNKHTVISLILFAISLLCKEIALIVPVLFACFIFAMGDTTLKRKVKYALPFFALSIVFLFFWLTSINGNLITPSSLEINTDFFKIMIFYVSMLLVPVNLHMQKSLVEIPVLSTMPFFISILIFLAGFYLAKKFFKTKLFNFAVSWFLVGLFPFWGWLKYSAQIAEHWLYIPSLGLFLLAGYWGERVIKMRSGKFSKAAKISIFTIIIILASLTVRQNGFWRDDITLYKYTLKFKTDNAKLLYNLGNAYLRKDMLKEAQATYYQTLRIQPDYAHAVNNLAIVRERAGDNAQALRLYKLARRLDPQADHVKNNLARLMGVETAYAQKSHAQEIDHSIYAKMLIEYTNSGWVDYKELKDNPALLDQYLKSIAMLDEAEFAKMDRQEKMALYINAYNAFTIKAIIDHYPVTSIKKIPGVWKKLKFEIAGKKITLDEIEHGILRAQFKDPRVHFTLVCAARGCPRLTDSPYTAKKLDSMLEAAGKNFLNDKTRNRLDKNKKVLYLSSIFKWFADDFGEDAIVFIGKYLNQKDYDYIKANSPKIKYQYDWSLNERN